MLSQPSPAATTPTSWPPAWPARLSTCPHVVARIYDPGRAEIYQRLGIPTVAAVRWSADQVLRRILPEQSIKGDFREASGRLILGEVQLDDGWVGRELTEIEAASGTPGGLPDALRRRDAARPGHAVIRRATSCTP